MAALKGVLGKLHSAKLQAEAEERERIAATEEQMRIQAELEVEMGPVATPKDNQKRRRK